MDKKGKISLVIILFVFVISLVWAPWITRDLALKRVGEFIGDCSFHHIMPVIGPNYLGASTERVWFGIKVSGQLVCPPDYEEVYKEYFVSLFGTVSEINSF